MDATAWALIGLAIIWVAGIAGTIMLARKDRHDRDDEGEYNG